MIKILLGILTIMSSCKIPRKSVIQCKQFLNAQSIIKKFSLQYVYDKKCRNINITTIINTKNIRIIGSKLGINILNVYISQHCIVIKSNETQKYSYQEILNKFGISLSFDILKLIFTGYCLIKDINKFEINDLKYIIHNGFAKLLSLHIGEYNIVYNNKNIIIKSNKLHCIMKELSCKIST